MMMMNLRLIARVVIVVVDDDDDHEMECSSRKVKLGFQKDKQRLPQKY